ncbi:MAG: preprotein translocase subunit SecA [Mariprofundales bacterium]
MFNILTRLFGSRNDRILKTMQPVVAATAKFEKDLQALDDEALQAKTTDFRTRLAEGAKLDDLLPEAFAVVREASQRVLGMRHFDVQIIGGLILHQGNIAEMKTGEGKTLVATLAVYLNALGGDGVHVITVNDYLAQRDAEWMGRLYTFLGLSVGVIVHGQSVEERQTSYAADITYGTNNEFGFDYLRDNMAFSAEELVQRPLSFAVVDEVDSVLVDEARTPLIISGQSEDASDLYEQADKIIKQLNEEDYDREEQERSVSFSEDGLEHCEELLRTAELLPEGSLYDAENVNIMHACFQSLRARVLFERENEYIVRNGEVIIIDEFTGRMMPGRRYSDGLHQALEAKEGVAVQPENQTLASVTFQNYFRMYEKLSGMTGTADTEAEEFQKIYGLEVIIVPTNQPISRDDVGDTVYRNIDDKLAAIIADIHQRHAKGQPVLVGTISIDKSEEIAAVLEKEHVRHEVLNAKHHEREADIVSQAGRLEAITIATNMAGRGTDIMLGGNPEMLISQLPSTLSEDEKTRRSEEIHRTCSNEHDAVVKVGGLHIIGTERHESRRIDNQLRGRAGRQGDPGSTQFYLCLEDDLMRIFGGEKMQTMMDKVGFEQGEAITHPWVTKAIENSQKKVEGRNFDTRKQVLEYDDVMNQQRDAIYSQRRELLESEDVHDAIVELRQEYVDLIVSKSMPDNAYAEAWKLDKLKTALVEEFALDIDPSSWVDAGKVDTADDMKTLVAEALAEHMQLKEDKVTSEAMRGFERFILLRVLDQHWKEHLLAMDHLRQSIGLRSYAQKQPLQEYKRESFELFEALLHNIRRDAMRTLHQVAVDAPEQNNTAEASPEPLETNPEAARPIEDEKRHYMHGKEDLESKKEPQKTETYRRTQPKVGRNDPCPCGSGKKYKQCHGHR